MTFRTVSTAITLFVFALMVGVSEAQPVQRIVVTNQGNFADGNGSVTIYDPVTQTTLNDLANDIGTIFQSATIVGERIYLMSNTAEQIDILRLETGERVGQIPNVASPRYMLVDGQTAYVTNLYKENFQGGTVTVIDLSNDQVTGKIDVSDNPEGMALLGDRLYVASPAFGFGSTLSVIDTSTGQVNEDVQMNCDGPRMLTPIPNNNLLVFCTGQTVWNADFTAIVSTTDGKVIEYDPDSGSQTEWFSKPTTDQSFGPGLDDYYAAETGEAYSFSGNQVLRSTGPGAGVDTLTLAGQDRIGALAYDAASDLLYVGRAPSDNPFTAAGYVAAYDRDGTEVFRFDAGIAPIHIAFQRSEATSVEEKSELPVSSRITSVFPNPTSGKLSIGIQTARPGHVHLVALSVTGARVGTVYSGRLAAGHRTLSWETSDIASGTYLLALTTEGGPSEVQLVTLSR